METDILTIKRWKRTEDTAKACGVIIRVEDGIGFTDEHGLNLGYFSTVAEAYAFMCGYDHKAKTHTTAFSDSDWKPKNKYK